MVHKPISIMILPIFVAGILMLGILAATGNAEESSNNSSSQESSQTGNGATSPPSSQETSNGKKPTELTLSASRNGPDKIVRYRTNETLTWVPLNLSGRLTSEGSGVANATIYFSCGGEPCEFQESAASSVADTDSGGHYSIGVLTTHKEKIEAGYKGSEINEEHLNLQSSEASTIAP